MAHRCSSSGPPLFTEARPLCFDQNLVLRTGKEPGFYAGTPVVIVDPMLSVGPGDTGASELRWHVPYAVALAAAYANEFLADVWTHRPPVATVTGVKLTRRTMHFDARRSMEELGLRPRPVAESLADEVAWFGALGWLA